MVTITILVYLIGVILAYGRLRAMNGCHPDSTENLALRLILSATSWFGFAFGCGVYLIDNEFDKFLQFRDCPK